MKCNMEIPSPKSLKKGIIFKEQEERKLFDIVLNKCIEGIKHTNKYTKKTFFIFTVPKILIGYITYNPNDCVLYITREFKNKGYNAHLLSLRDIYIDWSDYKKTNVIQKSNEDPVKKMSKLFPKAKNIKYVYE